MQVNVHGMYSNVSRWKSPYATICYINKKYLKIKSLARLQSAWQRDDKTDVLYDMSICVHNMHENELMNVRHSLVTANLLSKVTLLFSVRSIRKETEGREQSNNNYVNVNQQSGAWITKQVTLSHSVLFGDQLMHILTWSTELAMQQWYTE